MILAIDVGNTNIVLGGIMDNQQVFSARLASDRNKTADQYALDIQGILTMQKIRPEEIEELDREVGVERVRLVATDGATNFLRPIIDAMDAETFAKWVEYHLATCERQDLIGASHHTLDILKKK